MRSEYAANAAIRAGFVTRDSRAPEVIRRQREAIARHDARKRREARREAVARFIACAILAALPIVVFVTLTN